MSLFVHSSPTPSACSHTIHRPLGEISGLREVVDEVSRIKVTAFPFAMIRDAALSRDAVPGCYILADHASAYIGETSNLARRLASHAGDPGKAFAREVYTISGHLAPGLDKSAAIYLQHRLTALAENAGFVEVMRGIGPQVPDVSAYRRVTLDRYVDDSLRLLFDAGCRVFSSSMASMASIHQIQRMDPASVREISSDAPEDRGPIEIGVIAAPAADGELELDYCELWARGYPVEGGFIVAAGSEVRTQINSSAGPIVTVRRNELAVAGALMPIPGIADRLRLRTAVRFPSAAIAAKVITGAHVSSVVWIRPFYPRPVLVAA